MISNFLLDFVRTDLDGLIGVGNEGDEEAEHHIDEEGDEGVQVKSAEKPHHVTLVSHPQESGVHVVAVEEREEALGHFVQRSKLKTLKKSSHDFASVNRAKLQFLIPCHDKAQEQSSHRNSIPDTSWPRSSRTGSHWGTLPLG